jgi:outer membrane protein assembly factor BamB
MPRSRIALAALCALAAVAADWPQGGRDNTRNAVSPEKGAPLRWQLPSGRKDAPAARNVLWSAAPGLRPATPTVAGGLVWVGTSSRDLGGPKTRVDHAVLRCFREKDGKLLWQYASPRLKSDIEDSPYSGINCSPLAEGDRLYFPTNRGEVVCLDIAPLRAGTGVPKVLWKVDLRKEAGVRLNAYSMLGNVLCSIGASYKGRLYVATGNGVDEDRKVAAPKAPSLVCLDAKTGKLLWQDASPGNGIMWASFSSPLVAEVKGRTQVMHAQGDGWLRSFDPLTGKLLWKFDLNPRGPGRYRPGGGGDRNFPVAPPVLYEGRVYIATGQDPDDGPGVGHLWCIDPTKAPTSPDRDISPFSDPKDKDFRFDPRSPRNKGSGLVWHYGGFVVPRPKGPDDREVVFGRTLSAVAVADGLVIASELGGWAHCLDARTGKPHWVADLEDHVLASPLIVDGKVYIATALDVWVFALSKEERVLARNRGAAWGLASPVFANGALYLHANGVLHAIKNDGRADGHWPQWRGPGRLNVSAHRGLLAEWPKDGPPLAWRVKGIGEGVGGVAVAGGRAYVLGHRGKFEHLTCVDEATGRPLWSVPLGPATKENGVMRYLSQRTPLLDGNRAFAVTARGLLVCVRADTGKLLWRKDYRKDLGGAHGSFGCCDQLSIDGDRLVCVPGGKEATVCALAVGTGEVVWKCPLGDRAAYVGAVLAGGKGVRKHHVAVTAGGLVGVSTEGKLLWRNTRFAGNTANAHTPVPLGDRLFCASNYRRGVLLLALKDTADGVEAKEVFHQPLGTPSWHEMAVCLGEHAYVGTNAGLVCLRLKDGEVVWTEKRGKYTLPYSGTAADGVLYLRTQRGDVLLVKASPDRFQLAGLFRLPGAKPMPGSVAPVVTGGRLFLRQETELFCYDVLKGARPGKPATHEAPQPAEELEVPLPPGPRREPDTVFVPTPREVVGKMLEAAKVTKADLVVDLGCGDGRIVVEAARKYGCKAVGYDIDAECVRLSQEAVAAAKVGGLVTIEKKDLFTADLSKATVVTLYLPPRMLGRLLPQLEKMPKGARVVCHAFAVPGLVPERELTVETTDGLTRRVFVYTVPFRKLSGATPSGR